MMTVPVLLIDGVPLSVTFTSTVLVEGACASVGVQVNTPLVELRVMPEIGVSNVHVKFCGGCSKSLMTFVYVSVVNSFTVRLFVEAANVGGVLLSAVSTTSLAPVPPT